MEADAADTGALAQRGSSACERVWMPGLAPVLIVRVREPHAQADHRAGRGPVPRSVRGRSGGAGADLARALGAAFWFPIAREVSPWASAPPPARAVMVRDSAEHGPVRDGPGFDFLAGLSPAAA